MFASKPGMRRSSPMISGIRSEVPPSNGTPSFVPAKPMTAQSPFCAARSSTALSVAFWSRSSSTTLSTFAASISSISGAKLNSL